MASLCLADPRAIGRIPGMGPMVYDCWRRVAPGEPEVIERILLIPLTGLIPVFTEVAGNIGNIFSLRAVFFGWIGLNREV
jgi:hypothetical protein